jgi:hypothetical protein
MHHQKQKHHDRAICHFQKDVILTIHPGNVACGLIPRKAFTGSYIGLLQESGEQREISNDAKHVLFNLGRSYEDTKQWAQAISHYQLLFMGHFIVTPGRGWNIYYQSMGLQIKGRKTVKTTLA